MGTGLTINEAFYVCLQQPDNGTIAQQMPPLTSSPRTIIDYDGSTGATVKQTNGTQTLCSHILCQGKGGGRRGNYHQVVRYAEV